MEAPSDGLTDLERMQAKANSISDASLESSRRMRDMLIETQDTGQNTLAMLDTQGEQLNRVEANLDTINSEVVMMMMTMVITMRTIIMEIIVMIMITITIITMRMIIDHDDDDDDNSSQMKEADKALTRMEKW